MSTISNTTSVNQYQFPSQGNFGGIRKDFRSLASALQSGDATSAQAAFAALQNNLPAAPQSASTTASTAAASGPFGTNTKANSDYQSLAAAIGSNDTQAAQQALASLKADLKGTHKGHHSHGSKGTSSPTSNLLPTPTPAPTTVLTSVLSADNGTDKDGDTDNSSINTTA